MAYRVSISSTELVTRAEVVAYAKIENTDENSIIDALITSSREELEKLLKIPLITQVWAQTYDSFIEPVYAPFIPLTSAALEIADSDGNFSANTYISVKKDTGRIAPTDVFSPSLQFDGFKITFTYTVSTIDAVLKTAIMELASYRFYNRGNLEAAKIPASVLSMVGHLRVFSV